MPTSWIFQNYQGHQTAATSPSRFAAERTQDLLYGLNQLIYRGELSAGAVYVDVIIGYAGATEIFARHVDQFDEEAHHFRSLVGENPILFPNLHFSRTREESKPSTALGAGVIISAMGMCTADGSNTT